MSAEISERERVRRLRQSVAPSLLQARRIIAAQADRVGMDFPELEQALVETARILGVLADGLMPTDKEASQ